MGLGRWSVGDCCGDAHCACGPIRIVSVDGCTGEPLAFVEVKVRPSDGSEHGEIVLEGDTGAGGVLATDLPAGWYIVESILDGWHTHATAQEVPCGGAYVVALYRRYVLFAIDGCPAEIGLSATLTGSRIVVTGEGHTYELNTGDGSTAFWYPEVPGDYTWTATHPSGLFGELSGSITVEAVCDGGAGLILAAGGRLEPIEGKTCCWTSYGKGDHGDALPRGKVHVTTSAGDSWDFEGCLSLSCASSEAGQHIASHLANELAETPGPEPGSEGCVYIDYPSDLHYGTVSVKVKLEYSGAWRAWLAPPEMASHGRYDPMDYWACVNMPDYATARQTFKWWYLGSDCLRPTYDDGWIWLGTPTVTSENPLSVTFAFVRDSPATECWEWEGSLYDPIDCAPPPPIRWITLTEVL